MARLAIGRPAQSDHVTSSLCRTRRPHKGRCSEPRRAPKCNQGRPLRDVGPAGPVRSPVGHGHVINQACNMRMSTCAGLEAAVTSPWFAGLPVPVRVPRVAGLPDSRKQDFWLQETRFPVTRNKKSWSGVWLRRGLLYTHTHKWEDSFSAVPSFSGGAASQRSKVRIPLLADFLFRAVRAQSRARL